MTSFFNLGLHMLTQTLNIVAVGVFVLLLRSSFFCLSLCLIESHGCILGMFSVNQLTEKILVNWFSINRTETENGGQDGVMQNAEMHIAVHQYLIVKIIPLSHITGSLLIIWRGNNWKKSIQRRILESLCQVISRLQITVIMHTPLQTECWVFFRGQLNLGMLTSWFVSTKVLYAHILNTLHPYGIRITKRTKYF